MSSFTPAQIIAVIAASLIGGDAKPTKLGRFTRYVPLTLDVWATYVVDGTLAKGEMPVDGLIDLPAGVDIDATDFYTAPNGDLQCMRHAYGRILLGGVDGKHPYAQPMTPSALKTVQDKFAADEATAEATKAKADAAALATQNAELLERLAAMEAAQAAAQEAAKAPAPAATTTAPPKAPKAATTAPKPATK